VTAIRATNNARAGSGGCFGAGRRIDAGRAPGSAGLTERGWRLVRYSPSDRSRPRARPCAVPTRAGASGRPARYALGRRAPTNQRWSFTSHREARTTVCARGGHTQWSWASGDQRCSTASRSDRIPATPSRSRQSTIAERRSSRRMGTAGHLGPAVSAHRRNRQPSLHPPVCEPVCLEQRSLLRRAVYDAPADLEHGREQVAAPVACR
jgi:hypothetical protein